MHGRHENRDLSVCTSTAARSRHVELFANIAPRSRLHAHTRTHMLSCANANQAPSLRLFTFAISCRSPTALWACKLRRCVHSAKGHHTGQAAGGCILSRPPDDSLGCDESFSWRSPLPRRRRVFTDAITVNNMAVSIAARRRPDRYVLTCTYIHSHSYTQAHMRGRCASLHFA